MLGFLIGIAGIPAAPEEDPDVVEIPVVETLVAPKNMIQYKANSKLVSLYNSTNWNTIIEKKIWLPVPWRCPSLSLPVLAEL